MHLMLRLIDSLGQAVPDGLEETQMLAKPLISRSQDVLTHFDHSGTSNGPTPSHQQTPRELCNFIFCRINLKPMLRISLAF